MTPESSCACTQSLAEAMSRLSHVSVGHGKVTETWPCNIREAQTGSIFSGLLTALAVAADSCGSLCVRKSLLIPVIGHNT